MPRISSQAGREASERFAPWFSYELRQRGMTAGKVSYAARTSNDGFELKSSEVTAYATGATGPTSDRVIGLARLLRLDVGDALWYSHPAKLVGLAEMLADAGGNPFRLWRPGAFASPAAWSERVVGTPRVHAAVLLYRYFGPDRRKERRLLKAFDTARAIRQSEYFAALDAAGRMPRRMNLHLAYAEMILEPSLVPLSARLSQAAHLVAQWARAVGAPVFDDALQGWPEGGPIGTALGEKIAKIIARTPTMAQSQRLGRT